VETELIGVLGLLLLLVLIAIGVPIAVSTGLVGFLGVWLLAGWKPAFYNFGAATYTVTGNYVISSLPLFIILGYFAFNSGFAADAFEVGRRWLGHIAGGVSMATVTACAAFGACSGASTASAAVFSKMAIPEMLKYGYSPRLAAGVVAASGTFASMIPPSGLMIVYAILAETSVGRQLMAGLIPGLITAALYALSLYIRVKRNPAMAGGIKAPVPWKERFASIPRLWGVIIIAAVIIGGIMSGLFTPTESGAVGTGVALLMLLTKKGIPRWQRFTNALLEAGVTTAMVFLILVGVKIFSYFLSLSRLSNTIIEGIAGLGVDNSIVLAGFLVLFLIMGCFLNGSAIIAITIPILAPIVTALGFDLIWFGVLTLKTLEIGLVSPPVGLTCYVVSGVSKIPLGEVFRGIAPFIVMDIIVLVLMLFIPQIVLFLPNLMV